MSQDVQHEHKRNRLDSIVEAMPTRLIDLESRILITKDEIKAQYDRTAVTGLMSDFFRYAILSHRWGPKETTFDDLQGKKLDDLDPNDPGVRKLRSFGELASELKCRWAWSDTVCIDKKSSAELQEAINSMFSWYRNSAVCIVLLETATTDLNTLAHDVWFKRGWTLQELLAPKFLKFFVRISAEYSGEPNRHTWHWQELGSGNDKSGNTPLLQKVSEVTSIPVGYLQYHDNTGLGFRPGVEDLRVRMGWAAKRTTTRIEDLAYCLLGIFGISMPVIYGEKEAAFFRLQDEILKRTNDKGLFDWTGRASTFNSMLAAEPKCFVVAEKKPHKVDHLKKALFYITPMIMLWNYDVLMLILDYVSSSVSGDISNGSEIPSTLTSMGLRGKFQLYNITKIVILREPKDNDGFYLYKINANGLWQFEVETMDKLDARVVWGASAFSMYRLAVLHRWHWHFGGFNSFKGGEKLAILLEKADTVLPFSFAKKIPTNKPIMVQMTRFKCLAPQIIYIK